MSWIIFDAVEKIRTFGKRQELRLAEAIAANNLVLAKQLLERGVNPEARVVGHNLEPLIFLVYQKNWFTLPKGLNCDRPRTLYSITAKEQCLQLLLKHGVNPNVRDSLGRSVLEIAILWCLPDIVKLLLIDGADPDIRDLNGLTLLMKTAIWGIQDARPMADKLQIIDYLLDSGAEIDARSPDGKTALMYAVSNSRMSIIEFLVSSGASLTIADRQGNCAYDLIDPNLERQQQSYLRSILSQPQLNTARYSTRHFPEGDRQLALLINHKNHSLT